MDLSAIWHQLYIGLDIGPGAKLQLLALCSIMYLTFHPFRLNVYLCLVRLNVGEPLNVVMPAMLT